MTSIFCVNLGKRELLPELGCLYKKGKMKTIASFILFFAFFFSIARSIYAEELLTWEGCVREAKRGKSASSRRHVLRPLARKKSVLIRPHRGVEV